MGSIGIGMDMGQSLVNAFGSGMDIAGVKMDSDWERNRREKVDKEYNARKTELLSDASRRALNSERTGEKYEGLADNSLSSLLALLAGGGNVGKFDTSMHGPGAFDARGATEQNLQRSSQESLTDLARRQAYDPYGVKARLMNSTASLRSATAPSGLAAQRQLTEQINQIQQNPNIPPGQKARLIQQARQAASSQYQQSWQTNEAGQRGELEAMSASEIAGADTLRAEANAARQVGIQVTEADLARLSEDQRAALQARIAQALNATNIYGYQLGASGDLYKNQAGLGLEYSRLGADIMGKAGTTATDLYRGWAEGTRATPRMKLGGGENA